MSSLSSVNVTEENSEADQPAAIDLLVLTIPEIFIYKVPPLRSASGHRAEDWGLANPLCTGALQVFQADSKLRIVLYSYKVCIDPYKSSFELALMVAQLTLCRIPCE